MAMKWMLVGLAGLAVSGVLAQDVRVDPPAIQVPKFAPLDQNREPSNDRAECGCLAQCDAMWSAVPEGLESATHTRVHIASDSFVETYTPYRGQFGMLAGRATKRPDGHGGYRISGEFRSQYGGTDDIHRAEHLFYLILNEAAVGIQCRVGQASS